MAVQQHKIFPPLQHAQQRARIAQAVKVAGFVKGIVRHQENMPARGDFGHVQQLFERIEFQRRHAPAGIPKGQARARGVEGDGHGVIAQPAHQRETGGSAGFGQVGAQQGGEVFAVQGAPAVGVKIVVAGHGEGAAAGEGEGFH